MAPNGEARASRIFPLSPRTRRSPTLSGTSSLYERGGELAWLDKCAHNAPQQVKQREAASAVSAGAAVSDGEYLTTEEVAARLRVHPTTILRRLGAMDDADPARIPAVRVGRVWRIPRREFEEWLTRSGAASRPSGRQRRLF